LLKNIKRKGCNGKKLSPEDEALDKFEFEENEPIKSHKTVEHSKALVEHSETIIPKFSPLGPSHRINIKRPIYSPVSTPFRRKLID